MVQGTYLLPKSILIKNKPDMAKGSRQGFNTTLTANRFADLKIWFKVIAYQMAYVWDGLSHGKIKYVLYKWWQIDGLIYHP